MDALNTNLDVIQSERIVELIKFLVGRSQGSLGESVINQLTYFKFNASEVDTYGFVSEYLYDIFAIQNPFELKVISITNPTTFTKEAVIYSVKGKKAKSRTDEYGLFIDGDGEYLRDKKNEKKEYPVFGLDTKQTVLKVRAGYCQYKQRNFCIIEIICYLPSLDGFEIDPKIQTVLDLFPGI